jgi:hypothetical protein
MYMGLMMLGRLQYTQLGHECLSLLPSRLTWVPKGWKDINHQGWIKLLQHWFKHEVWQYNLRYKLTNSVWNNEYLPVQWKASLIVPMYKKGDTTVCSNYWCTTLLLTTHKILSNILLPRLTQMYPAILDIITVDFEVTYQALHSSNT